MSNLIGKRVTTVDGQHSEIVIKHFKPTGRNMTVHIKEKKMEEYIIVQTQILL